LVSERAGHANVAITLSVYTAFIPSLADQASAGFDAALADLLAKPVGEKSAAIHKIGDVE
jgi:hypothetical protein